MSSNTPVSQSVTRQTVVVCGSLHFDVVVNAPHLPRLDETVVGAKVSYICGGKGGNQAVAAALNGASTAFYGCIGDDEFGSKLAAHLEHHGIDCSGLQTICGESGMSVAIVNSQGDYGAVIVSASNQNIDCDHIAFPESTGLVLLQNEIPDTANLALAANAKAHNIPVILNAAPYCKLSAAFESFIDILILNRVEAEQFFDSRFINTEDIKTRLSEAQSTINTIVVTLGEDGLVYRDSCGQVHYRPACSVRVCSSHGAGDMFCGALASRLVTEADFHEALDYAMATAAWYVSATLDERSKLNEQAIERLLTAGAH
jgi:ribokinase